MAKKHRIPPDPERQNNDRASWAQMAIAAFQGETGTDDCDAICDLIADLAHLCDREPERYGNMAQAIRRAAMYYDEETSGKGKQFEEVSQPCANI